MLFEKYAAERTESKWTEQQEQQQAAGIWGRGGVLGRNTPTNVLAKKYWHKKTQRKRQIEISSEG